MEHVNLRPSIFYDWLRKGSVSCDPIKGKHSCELLIATVVWNLEEAVSLPFTLFNFYLYFLGSMSFLALLLQCFQSLREKGKKRNMSCVYRFSVWPCGIEKQVCVFLPGEDNSPHSQHSLVGQLFFVCSWGLLIFPPLCYHVCWYCFVQLVFRQPC